MDRVDHANVPDENRESGQVDHDNTPDNERGAEDQLAEDNRVQQGDPGD